MNLGSKMVIDAQRGRPAGSAGVASRRDAASARDGGSHDGPPASVADPRSLGEAVIAHRLAWGALLVVQTRDDGRALVGRLIRRPEYAAVPFVVAVSPDVPLDDDELLLWGIFTRFDCARDVVPAATETRGA